MARSDAISEALNTVNNGDGLELLADLCQGLSDNSCHSLSPSATTHYSDSPPLSASSNSINSPRSSPSPPFIVDIDSSPANCSTETQEKNGSSAAANKGQTEVELSPTTPLEKPGKKRKSAAETDDQLPKDFKVLPLRQLVKEKVESKVLDTTVRKTIVADNCNAVWQFSQTLRKEQRVKMAKMIVEQYPFLKQSYNPPEVRLFVMYHLNGQKPCFIRVYNRKACFIVSNAKLD